MTVESSVSRDHCSVAPARRDDRCATSDVHTAIFPIASPITFVTNGCAVVVTRWENAFEVRLVGDVADRNSAHVARVLDAMLTNGLAVTLVLQRLTFIDSPGVAMITEALDTAFAARTPWSVVDVQPDIHDHCNLASTCRCVQLRRSTGPAAVAERHSRRTGAHFSSGPSAALSRSGWRG